MPDANGLVETLKQAALDAIKASKPASIYFGEVVSSVPLKINVEQKMELGEKQLVLTKAVAEYRRMVTVEGEGTKEMVVHNGLAAGDGVVLLRQQGGQKFIVLDRIGGR